jgi:hypothetical protein
MDGAEHRSQSQISHRRASRFAEKLPVGITGSVPYYCIEHDLTLLTANNKHFAPIEHLRSERFLANGQ